MASPKNERSGFRFKLGALEFVFFTSAPPDKPRLAKIIVPILVAFLGCSGAIVPPLLGLAFNFLTSKPSSVNEPDRIVPDALVRKESPAPTGKKADMPGKMVQLKQATDTSKNAQPSSEPVSRKSKVKNTELRTAKVTAESAPTAAKDAKTPKPATLGSAVKCPVAPPVRLPSIFLVKYRCQGSYTKKTDGQSARIFAAHLNVLGIPWRGQDLYTPQGFYWYTIISYGGRGDWLERDFLDEFEARAFASGLQAHGFQATLCAK